MPLKWALTLTFGIFLVRLLKSLFFFAVTSSVFSQSPSLCKCFEEKPLRQGSHLPASLFFRIFIVPHPVFVLLELCSCRKLCWCLYFSSVGLHLVSLSILYRKELSNTLREKQSSAHPFTVPSFYDLISRGLVAQEHSHTFKQMILYFRAIQ